MARRSLKPQLNQIRAWVREGRTDAWIAHQLDISASELREFRKQHDLTPDDEEPGTGEVDLRDEIEAEVEAATTEEVEEDEDSEEEGEDSEKGEAGEGGKRGGGRGGRSSGGRGKGRGGRGGGREEGSGDSGGSEDREDEGDGEGEGGDGEGEGGGGQRRRRRRRGRRGGRGRKREIEATFDHGERDGYGLWLDASVKDNPVYSEHWAGKREVTVRIEADQIVIRRAGGGENGDGGDSSDD